MSNFKGFGIVEDEEMVVDEIATAKLQAEKNELSNWLNENRNTTDEKLYRKNVRRYNKLVRSGVVYVDVLAQKRSQIKDVAGLAKFLTELK